MSRERPNDAEAEIGRVLRQTSDDYGDLPDHVGHRLDRVLETLPTADTLHRDTHHHGSAFTDGLFERWAERLRPKRVRYALVSAAAAVLITVGAVATALQVVTPSGDDTSADSAELFAEEETARDGDEGAAPEAENDEQDTDDTTAATEAEPGSDGITGVETFTTGTDYAAGTDLLAALRELGSDSTDSTTGEIPPELAELAAGGDFWQRCQEALAEQYSSLLVAVDFAYYESEPAIMVLLIGDTADIAVALTPACADGVIEPLTVQS